MIPQKDLPDRSAAEPPRPQAALQVKAGSPRPSTPWWGGPTGLVNVALITVFIGCTALAIFSGPVIPLDEALRCLVSIAVIALMLVGVWFARRNAYRRMFRVGEARVRPALLYVGDRTDCHVDFVARRTFHLLSVHATISAEEKVTYSSGSSATTEHHIVSEKNYTRPFDRAVNEGESISFDCPLPVEPGAPASFRAERNELSWTVKLKVEMASWPSWEKTFPITVLPS